MAYREQSELEELLNFDERGEDSWGDKEKGHYFYPGLKRPPCNVKEILKEWKSSKEVSSKKSSTKNPQEPGASVGSACCNSKAVCVVCVVLVVILAAILGYIAGLLVGRDLSWGRADGGGGGMVVNCSAGMTGSAQVEGQLYDWGSSVAINGTSYDVFDIFSSKLKPKDICDYL